MARIVVIAPGRGTYNKTELGSLKRFADHPKYAERVRLTNLADQLRRKKNRVPISELDAAESYRPGLHLPGENASGLIFTCSAADMGMIAETHQIVAVLGNSMGWYTTLYTSGTLDFESAFEVVDTMGAFQENNIQGAQLIYPLIDDEWHIVPDAEAKVMALAAETRDRGEDYWVDLSIRLGGFLVLAGTNQGIKTLLETLPKVTLGANTYPFQLARHAAFHTPIMQDASYHGFHTISVPWGQPQIPMIDGRGHQWKKYQTGEGALRDYTFGHQVLKPYDFTASVRVALREYNPDHLVLLGPGETLGGAIAHVIIAEGWRGINSKTAFLEAQKGDNPPLIAMNRPDQARFVI